MNHAPTRMRMRPPQALMVGAPSLMVSTRPSRAVARSTASEKVDEPEEHEPGEGASPPQRCLLAQYAVERGLEAPQVDLDAVELDETEQDEDGADDDAQGPAGAAGEGDIFDQRSGSGSGGQVETRVQHIADIAREPQDHRRPGPGPVAGPLGDGRRVDHGGEGKGSSCGKVKVVQSSEAVEVVGLSAKTIRYYE